MYPFLENLPIEELRALARRGSDASLRAQIAESDRDTVLEVLFSIFGYEILYERGVRRALLLSLPKDSLHELRGSGSPADAKSFDIAHEVAGRAWRRDSPTVRMFASEFDIPPTYLPEGSTKVETVEQIEPHQPLGPLFDYQEELAQEIFNHLANSPGAAALLQLPTGAGKTRTALEGIVRFLNQRAQAAAIDSIIWLAHTEELCEQAVDSFRRIWRSHGSYEARIVRYWGSHAPDLEQLAGAVVVAGYSKLSRLGKAAPGSLDALLSSTSLVVVDEAHKALAPTIAAIIDRRRKDRNFSLLGLSATPGRGVESDTDNRRLSELFDGNLLLASSLGPAPIDELQSRGILARIKRITITTDYSLERSRDTTSDEDGDLSPDTLRRLAKDRRRNDLLAKAVAEQVRAGRQTLVFCCSVDHARHLATQSAIGGIRSAYVDCKMRSASRHRVIHAFRDQRVDALFNYGVLSTGFDAPGIGCVVIGRPTTSIVLYSQMVGRGLRGSVVGGSEKFVLVDVRDNLESFGGAQEIYQHFDSYWLSD